MAGIKDYSATASNNTAAPPNGWPENMAPSDVNNCARQMMADIRSWYQDAQWTDLGDTPAYASTSSFTIAGDVTATYTVGRRLRLEDATTLYGTIATSSYSSPDTTITVTLDSGSLSVALTAVALGIMTPDSIAFPDPIKANVIAERTSGSGVTVDGVLLKDNGITASGTATFSNASGVTTDTITERTSAAGVTIDGTLLKDNGITASGVATFSNASGVTTDTITERTAAAGVTVDGVLLKDGGITTSGANSSAVNSLGILTYTPTLTNSVNLLASTALELTYIRINDVVIVGGRCSATPTSSGADTQLGVSLPIASNFTDVGDAFGSGGSILAAGSSNNLIIYADVSNDRLIVRWTAQSTAAQAVLLLAAYKIK
jgi:hypothetical protein